MITASGLGFSYANASVSVLSDINFAIKAGEYVSILGDNGSGKSTLVRLILRLLKPTAGTIRCDARRIGYVPQKGDFFSSQFPITVQEMMYSYGRLLKLRDRGSITEHLRRVGMDDYRNALVGTLSGGQLQRVLIGRALLGGPDLLVLDEPSTGVDKRGQAEIYGILRGLNRRDGITVVSVEHNLEAAVHNSTLIYHLADGHGHLCSPDAYIREFADQVSEVRHV